jgi:hypothetical protein
MDHDISENQRTGIPFPLGIIIAAVIMMVFGLAEVVTGFTHQFFGLTTVRIAISTYLGVALGVFYFASGIVILTRMRWAAVLAIVLLCGDVIGRIAMVAFGLYPVNSFRQSFSIVVGTVIAACFVVYIGLKLKSFR